MFIVTSLIMVKSNKIILFDIDHTLFDTDKFRRICFSELGNKLHQSDIEGFMTLASNEYKKMRENHGTLRPAELVDTIAAALGIDVDSNVFQEVFFNEQSIDKACYSDVSEVLQKLSFDVTVKIGILSFGVDSFQRKKIQSIIHLLHSDSIYINEVDKKENIPTIIEKHQGEQIYIIDDVLKILETFETLDPSVITVLIERDIDKPREESKGSFNPDFKINELSELLSIIK